MNGPSRPGRRVRIDRLELDLRGITPATAEAAARALGPALSRALASRRGSITPAGRVEAGRIESPPSPSASRLAAGIARRIATTIRRGDA